MDKVLGRGNKEEIVRLTKTLEEESQKIIDMNHEVNELHTIIRDLKMDKKALRERNEKLQDNEYKISHLNKTIRSLESWLPSLAGIDGCATVKSLHSGFSVAIKPRSYSKVKFPEMTFSRYQNQRDNVSITLGLNPVLNDIFGKQLRVGFDKQREVKVYGDSITVYGGIKSISDIVKVYIEALEKYDKFITL